MECNYTSFDRAMHMVKPAEEERQLKDLVSIIQEDGLSALLDYAVQEGLVTEPLSHTLFDGIVMWEDLEGNYYEEDYDKLMLLHEKLGVTEQVFETYREDNMDETFMWPYSTEAGDFDLELTKQDVLDCSHQGPCDEDCERVAQKDYVQEQLQDVPSDAIVEALLAMGITIEDKTDRKALYEQIVWDAACKLREDITGSLNS